MIKTTVDEIITSLARSAALRDVRFMCEYSREASGKPLSGFLAVVKYGSPKTTGRFLGGYVDNNVIGEICSYKLKLRLYCGSGISGANLSEKCDDIVSGIKHIQDNITPDKIEVSETKRDSVTDNIYKDIECLYSFNIIGG